ncbi:MAG: hypothetical protein JXB15_12245 [Anaerolineales bacterium]|nr:hypothetical protein [Anaerolineales bacterium]
MDIQHYRQFLQEYVNQAIQNSDGTISGIAGYLEGIQVKGLLLSHKEERRRALADVRQAFDEHRHWPLEIILSQLGVEAPPK